MTVRGPRIVVEPGDSPWRITEQFTRLPLRWPELVSANPAKRRTAAGTFVSLVPGEELMIPVSWLEKFGLPRPESHAPAEECHDAGALPPGWKDTDLEIVKSLAKAWNVSTDDLLATWFWESGFDYRRVTPAGVFEYAGLNAGRVDLMDQALSLPKGTWKAIVLEKPLSLQLQAIGKFWDKLFRQWLPEPPADMAAHLGVTPGAVIHAVNFLPAKMRSLTSALSPLTKKGEAFYRDNAGLDHDQDGAITLVDLDRNEEIALARMRQNPALAAVLDGAKDASPGNLATLYAPIAGEWRTLTGESPYVPAGFAPIVGGGGGVVGLALAAGLAYAYARGLI